MILAIVPAAGLSRRMGVPKQTLPFAGTTVIGHIVDELQRSRVDEIRVVVGHQADRVRAALAGRGVSIVENPSYQRTDMLGSIRAGLAVMPLHCQAVLVALGDQPALKAEWVDALLVAFSTNGRGIVVPVWDGRRGHPLLFAARYCGELLTEHEQLGLRGLLVAHPDDVLELPIPTASVLADIDSPADYQRELARLRHHSETPKP